MDLVTVTISCPITWWSRCQWIHEHCPEHVDNTYWAAWQIGMDDIRFTVSAINATMYYLIWD